MVEKHNHTYYLSENNIPYKELFCYGLSIDCVIFGYHQGAIKVLLIERGAEPYINQWALPGDLVYKNEDLNTAAARILHRLTGLENIFMEQFHTFGKPDRHPAGRVTTVGFFSLVKNDDYYPLASSWAKATQWFDIFQLPELAFDHQEIVKKAITTLQKKVRTEVLGFELLPEKFTLLDLQNLYEALLASKFDKPNFRKKILAMDLLVPLDEVRRDAAHRPAKLFSFDAKRYRNLKKHGFSFEL